MSSLKPVKLLGPCKRTQHCWPTTPNTVGPNNVVTCCFRLHRTTSMLALVGTCCVQFETGQTFRPMQTDATLLANNTQHFWAQHVASVCMEPQQCWHLLTLIASSLKPVKLLGPCKRTQHVGQHVVSVCMEPQQCY